jgi:hypothetical protein
VFLVVRFEQKAMQMQAGLKVEAKGETRKTFGKERGAK